MQEKKDSSGNYFVTLTYDQDNLPLIDQWSWTVGTLYKKDLQLFFKSLRSNLLKFGNYNNLYYKKLKSDKIAPRLRYFACGEYGKLGDRPHYHLILFNYPKEFIEWDPINKENYSPLIEDTWAKGKVDIGEVEQASAHYVAKYTLDPLLTKWLDHDNRQRPFATMSRRPGIGASYYQNEQIKNYFISSKNSYAYTQGNIKQPLGRYYKEKLFEGHERDYRKMSKRSKDFAEEQNERQESYIKLQAPKGVDPEMYYLQVKREQEQEYNRRIGKIIKNQKL